MYNPNPVPPFELVVNFENNFGIIVLFIPIPLSLALISIVLISIYFFSIIISMEPLFVNLIALSSKLEITWLILVLSANMVYHILFLVSILYLLFHRYFHLYL